MNIDFHYYATFLAAKFAGFTQNEAVIIAHAAQYVDDSNAGRIDPELEALLQETPQPTVMAFTEFPQCTPDFITPWSPEEMGKMQKIWMSFHLLPGNLNGQIPFQGVTSYTSTLAPYLQWQLDAAEKDRFRLMCLHDSDTIQHIINHTQQYFQTQKDLTLIGLRMHVLADSWAHTYFMGRPAWYVNEMDGIIEEFDEGCWHPLNIHFFDHLYRFEDIPEKREYAAFTNMCDFHGIVYLAHARFGLLPDYPYMHFRYRPQWLSRLQGTDATIERDNSRDFLLAFRQMVYALKCIRNNEIFQIETYDSLAECGGDTEIKAILTQRTTDSSESWNNLIERSFGFRVPPYDKEAWRCTFRNTADKKNTFYYRFNQAAIIHRNCVEAFLQTAGLSLTK